MITFRINLHALSRPLCWVHGHRWNDYLVVNAWSSEGRYCRRCKKSQLVRYRHEFAGDESITVRTDWNSTEQYTYETLGKGTEDDPIRYERRVR